jgi:glucose/arabinose dehydrogenase
VPIANRITLLRDADGDGVAEMKTVFAQGLNSPFGMALVGLIFMWPTPTPSCALTGGRGKPACKAPASK